MLMVSPCVLCQNWASAIAMMAVYFIFFIEFAAYRIGTAKLAKLNVRQGALRECK